MKSIISAIYTLLVGVGIAAIVFGVSLLPVGLRTMGPLENIDGIPYAAVGEKIVVLEKLAHMDVYLTEPVLFKRLLLTVEFDPQQLSSLDVGVREGPFWLSYPKYSLYTDRDDTSGRISRTVSIPLTDKIQEENRSIDVMFFATSKTSTSSEDEGTEDPTHWELYDIAVSTEYAMPTMVEVKDYVRSVLKQERPL